MRAERRKLTRLRRLERVRSIARRHAADASAEAEAALAQLNQLAERTHALAADYTQRLEPACAGDLARTQGFAQGLLAIRAAALGDARRARTLADARQADLASAERRRASVQDRAEATERALANRAAEPILAARRAAGTGLE